MKLIIFYFISFLLYDIVNANDLSNGGNSNPTSGGSNSSTTKKEYTTNDGNCPIVLEKWVDDDFRDKVSFGFNFRQEATTCQSSVRGYQQNLKDTQRESNFSEPAKLGNYFSEKYKGQIHSSYQDRYLKDCNFFAPWKSTAIQTRFYAASSRIEAVNSPIIDEVSYYDSVLPKSTSVLQGIECTPVFPDINKKCLEYKTQAHNCQNNKKQNFEHLVEKTKNNLRLIEDLFQAHKNCVSKIKAEPGSIVGLSYTEATQAKIKTSCDPFLQVIELKTNETPWIRGEIFKKIAIKRRSGRGNYNASVQYDMTDGNIEKAITEQMTANRKALTDNYKNNLENFRCLSGPTRSNGEDCDFKKIRTDLSVLPILNPPAYSGKNPKDFEAQTYYDAESCMLDRGEDREKTKQIIDSSGTGILLTVATLGIGSVASGIRAVNAASKVGRSLAIANGALGASLTTADLKHTYESCSQESKLTLSLSTKSEITAENICADPKSPLSQARKKESDCLVNALLSAPGVLPFLGAVPALTRLTSKTKTNPELKKFIKNMSGRENLRKQDLAFAGALNKEERVLATEGILSRNLSQKEKEALIQAHEVGGLKSYGQYTETELAEKRTIMKAAGFSERESETLLWKGITGWSKAEMIPMAQKRASEFFGKPITKDQATSIVGDLDLMGKSSKEVRLKNLTDAGFTPQQAQEIMDMKLNSSGSLSATLTTPSAATQTPRTTASAPPPPPAQGFNPFIQDAGNKGKTTPDALNRIANGSNPTETEARMGLSAYASNNNISGATAGEKNFKAMQKLADQTFKDAEDIQKAMASPRLSPNDRKKLTETYSTIKAKCQALPILAAKAGLNGSNLLSNLNGGIIKFCKD